jgi:hypothetical protein
MRVIGVWMSRAVLDHKRDTEFATQVWNLRDLPEGFVGAAGPHRLFVAVDGHWRGYFPLLPGVMQNDADPGAPFTLAFDPRTWCGRQSWRNEPPTQERDKAFTVSVPAVSVFSLRFAHNRLPRKKGFWRDPTDCQGLMVR